MIHPLKAPSSYDCDGCGHHASFHQMESLEDERVVRRWKGEGRGVIGWGEEGEMGSIEGGIGGSGGLQIEGTGMKGIEEARNVKRLVAIKEMKRVDGLPVKRLQGGEVDGEVVEELNDDAYEDGDAVLKDIIMEGRERWSAAVAEGAKRRRTAKMVEKEVVEVLDGEDRGDEVRTGGRTGRKRKGRGG